VRALLLVAALAFGCSDPENTQYLPIGSRCGSDGTCGTTPFECLTMGFNGGYCSKACATDGDCPADAVCSKKLCLRRCAVPTDCRENEGYGCHVESAATSYVCEPGPGPMDLGPPSG
jgi:hypothetical protein